jgi:2-polyprenyl-3-methyl-5-hydroxy-6-metoxy-1,4-benzoquinol methylase
VSAWYDGLVGEGQHDHFSETILPGVLRMLPQPLPKRVFDLACGQGYVSEALAQRGCEVVGLDAAAGLISAAEARLRTRGEAGRRSRFVTGDARALESVLTTAKVAGKFDAALCIMAVMNIDPIDGMLAQLAARIEAGGTLLLVMLHPAFRAPAKSGWMWRDSIAQGSVQLRTIESYLTPFGSEIVMNPGQVARGAKPVVTKTYHRPLGFYVAALARAGFALDGLEEWASNRRSTSGPRAAEENRSRAEIPLFLAVRAKRL